MGGTTFMNIGKGKTAQEAFNVLCEQARYEFGHRYSGTIGEKRSFVMINVPATLLLKDGSVDKEGAADLAERMIDDQDPRIDDKWGPAGCIRLGNNEWLFFGWAST